MSEPLQKVEIISNGRAEYPDVVFNLTFEELIVLDFFSTDFSQWTTLGDSDAVVLVDGSTGPIVSGGDGVSLVLVTPFGFVNQSLSGSNALGLFGTETKVVVNVGIINGDVATGSGGDLIVNFGFMDFDVRTGAGDDIFINDQITVDGLSSFGFVGGTVFMGSGDDIVLNSFGLGDVNLGAGNDFYAAITPLSLEDNFDNPLVTAGEIRAGTGNDTVFGGANDDRIFGGSGNDILNGHNGNDLIAGGNNKDRINGGNGDDRLFGQNGSDRLDGGKGNDIVNGGNGGDMLIGGRNDDILTGGTGSDTFRFFGDSGADVITDFEAGRDVLEFTKGDFTDLDVLAYTTYADGNAFIDLTGLYRSLADSPSSVEGISITLLGIDEGDLTIDNIAAPSDPLLAM
ncbi:MAG: calcium-binding protein [Pseudomonadota bacterium]